MLALAVGRHRGKACCMPLWRSGWNMRAQLGLGHGIVVMPQLCKHDNNEYLNFWD
jgi:hypothetical protein